MNALTEESIRPSAMMADKASCIEADRAFLLDRRDRWVHAACPACGDDAPQPFGVKDTIEYQRCDSCATVYTSPRPSESLLHEFYASSQNYAYWNTHIFPATQEARRERIYRPRAQRTESLMRSHGEIGGVFVEVGAGFGTFCEEVRDRGIAQRVIAIEPTQGLAQTCRDKGLETIEEVIEKIDLPGIADTVAAFEVIEHLFDPRAFIERCASFLKPNGLLLLSCPSCEGFGVAELGLKSATYDHEHLNYFTPTSLELLVNSCGLTVVEVATPGELDADLVRQAALRGEKDLSNAPMLRKVLIDDWDRLGGPFQQFLAEHRMSSHLWIAARKPEGSSQ